MVGPDGIEPTLNHSIIKDLSPKNSPKSVPELSLAGTWNAAEIILVFMIFVVALIFDVRLESQFTLPKLLALRLGTIGLLGCWLYNYRQNTTVYVATWGKGNVNIDKMDGDLMPISKTFLLLTLIFASWLVLSTIKAYHVPTALWGDYGWYNGLYTQLNYLVLMLIVATLPIDVKKILKAFIIAASLVALYACLQWAGLDPFKFPNERPTSTIGNAVPMAAMIALAILFCLYFIFNPTTKKTRSGLPSPPNFLWYIPSFMCLFAIIISGSRMVQVSTIIGMSIMLCAIYPQRKDTITSVVMALFTIGVIISVFLPSERYNIEKILHNDSTRLRTQYMQTAMDLIEEHPMSGVGLDNFVIAYPMYRDKALQNEKNLQTMVVHNGYLDLAVKSGIPALLLYLGLIGFVLFKLDKRKTLLATAFMAAILIFLIQDLSGWVHLGLTPFFWIILGLAIREEIPMVWIWKEE